MRLLLAAVLSLTGCPSHNNPPVGSGLPDAGPLFDGGLPDPGPDVLQHHKSATRDGLYLDPAFTRAAAAGLHALPGFSATVTGAVYAQPLFVAGTPDLLVIATESNEVSALNAQTGAPVWRRTVAPPVPRAQLPCGNIDPLGITGTPVIDAQARTIYLDAMTLVSGAGRHLIFALSLDDGTTRAGWPVDVGAVIAGFESPVQSQRAALTLLGGTLYVPYGGHFGDCGNYSGRVVAVPTSAPQTAAGWKTRVRGAGIWGPSGIASDGTSLFVTTGNGFGSGAWEDSEAVFRFTPSLAAAESFYPSNWEALDSGDTDLGGVGTILVHAYGATPSDLAVALGKDGKAYLLDRAHLGGAGGQVSMAQVASGGIFAAPAAYTASSGNYLVFAGTPSNNCSGDLTAIRISPAAPPVASFAWCANSHGRRPGAIATTTDGHAESLVWAVGSEGDNRLRAFNGETGAVVFNGGGAAEAMGNVRRFQSPIAAKGRIYVAGDNKVYAFTP